jgi:hypothetical protein
MKGEERRGEERGEDRGEKRRVRSIGEKRGKERLGGDGVSLLAAVGADGGCGVSLPGCAAGGCDVSLLHTMRKSK